MHEILRLIPPVRAVSRGAADDISVPLAEPIKGRDGNMIYELDVAKGTSFFIRKLDRL